MDKRNRPGQPPRVPGWGGTLFKRSRHLAEFDPDHTVCMPTFPGPGQRPDSNFFIEENYVAPKDWPHAGQLLRAPQVAWLSCQTLDDTSSVYRRTLAEKRYETWHLSAGSSQFFTGDYSPVSGILLALFSEYASKVDSWGTGGVESDGSQFWSFISSESNTYVMDHDGSDGTGTSFSLISIGPAVQTQTETEVFKDGVDGHPWWTDTSIPNPFKPIFERMHQEVFPAVKARIESLRPGRTWVDFHDWDDHYTDPPNEYWFGDRVYTAQYLPMIVSHIENFYGTNFLHVYLGVAKQIDDTPFVAPAGDTAYAFGKLFLKLNSQKYAGFRVQMFGLNVNYDSFDAASPMPYSIGSPSGPTIRRGHGPNYVFTLDGGHHSDPEPFNDTIPLDELWESYPSEVHAANMADQAATVAAFDAGSAAFVLARETERDEAIERARAMAEDLEEYGFSYEGEGQDLDVDALVELIAEHYGFDPKTGEDRVMV